MANNIWKTNISKVYWNVGGKIEKAKLYLGAKKPREVSWFDELFLEGIEVFKDPEDSEDPEDPEDSEDSEDSEEKTPYPMTMLLKGPPGDGKTTLALELCHHLGKNKGIQSTYISLESEKKQIIKNFSKYGWKNSEKILVYGLEHTLKWTEQLLKPGKNTDIAKFIPQLVMSILNIRYPETLNTIIDNKGHDTLSRNISNKIHDKSDSKILVFDSLNIIPIDLRTQIFIEFLKIAQKKKSKIKLIIFILDGKSDNDYNPFWEYMCDTIIEMNHRNENDYLLKTIEIVKSRFQKHILGKHQIKIYSKPSRDSVNTVSQKKDNIVSKQRQHPCIQEGGIFIFPSVHFYLSKYNKFGQSGTLEYDATLPDTFNDFLEIQSKKGFPNGRCTALIGCRGGHKSHLAYLHILSRLTGKYPGVEESDVSHSAALIISLRDDETMISSTLDGILKHEVSGTEWKTTEQLIEKNRLEILYYPPGYISPEEFIHRIFVNVNKLKKQCKYTVKDEDGKEIEKDGNVTVIFNSLDQIAARFPLCAKFDIFIPSIVQILIGEGITSIFIAVDEKDQPVEQYGLLPMADLILSFHKYNIREEDYFKITGKKTEGKMKIHRDEIIITVERFAGGKKAGDKGLLELLPNEEGGTSLKFTKLESLYLDKGKRTD
jgi:KaiC/GvpD/RAD55 family RecA-like ATPase